jgi:signal transduction histidine kinase
MSLRSRIFLILVAVVLLYAAVDHATQRVLVYPSFEELELEAGRTDVERVLRAFEGEIEHLDKDCADWSSMVETRDFVLNVDPERSRSDMLRQIFETHGISVLYACRLDGVVRFGEVRDVESGAKIELRDFPSEKFASSHPLLTNAHYLPSDDERVSPMSGPISGVFLTERGPMLVSSRPIVGPSERATPVGKLILGRLLDQSLIEKLRDQTGVRFDILRVDDAVLPDDVRTHADEISSTDGPVLNAASDTELVGYAAIPDIRSPAALFVRAVMPRSITERGSQAVRYGFVSTIAAGLLLLLVLLNVLQRTVVRPIGELTALATEIGRSDDVDRRIASKRTDEVGTLAHEFDSMLGKLARSRAQLVDTARAAGMSEIATGVLHNVGNVLNSVNVSATLVAEKSRSQASTDFANVISVLRPEAHDLAGFLQRDPRGQHLFPMLDEIANQLIGDRQAVDKEVRTLLEGIEHIKELVHAQQGLAGRAGVRERLSIQNIIDSAIDITDQPNNAVRALEVVREYEELATQPVDRHRLMQILVNVIQNARQALQAAGSAEPRLVLRLRGVPGAVRIEVEDNGVGIPSENLTRIFNHGFTTKPGGHGFGLHASANAATEMGGKLTASSAGGGRGACFVIEFPVEEAAQPMEVAA